MLYLYNRYLYGGQYQDIQTAQGSWYGPVEMILPEPVGEENISSTVRTATQGQSIYSDIAIHISNYCVYCIEDLSLTHHITAQSTEIFQGIKKPTTCPHISLTIVLLY
jgi:hypothetical protein